MTVSIEGFVLQNLLMNALILILAARLAGVRAGKLRIGLASALGCGYAVCAYLPWGRPLLGLLPRTAACAGMTLLLCGGRLGREWRRTVRAFAFIWISTALLGGTGAGLMYLLGARRGYSGAELKALLDRSLKPVGMILLVIACGGVIRWMLQDCGLGQVIGPMLEASPLPLVVVAFLIAVMVRASVGSSIVAMTMASGIMAAMPAVAGASVLMRAAICLAICGGATALSHVNDAGFWMCSSFLEIDEKTTLKSWTVMETLIGLSGLACALVISFFA